MVDLDRYLLIVKSCLYYQIIPNIYIRRYFENDSFFDKVTFVSDRANVDLHRLTTFETIPPTIRQNPKTIAICPDGGEFQREWA